MEKRIVKFIDLFAGIGGFHESILKVFPSSNCIAAVEYDIIAQQVYKNSFNILPLGDINSNEVINELDKIIKENDGFDILFAGFPCQTFSKAGKREGFNDETRGTLFYRIEEILQKHKPKYILLENVRNLVGHKSGEKKSMEIILEHIRNIGYAVDYSILSPHRLKPNGIPQLRERVFIYGILNENHDNITKIKKNIENHFYKNKNVKIALKTAVEKYLIPNYTNDKNYKLDEHTLNVLNVWEELNRKLQVSNKQLISPIWLDTIFLNKDINSDLIWKKNLVLKNKSFYDENKKVLEEWYSKHNKLETFNKTQRKFEWNANNTIKSIFDGIIQFRPSGIRVKKPDYFPTFVAINQKPIIGWQKRYISPEEIKKLYGFQHVKLGNNISESYKQLGNSVSADVAAVVIRELFNGEIKHD